MPSDDTLALLYLRHAGTANPGELPPLLLGALVVGAVDRATAAAAEPLEERSLLLVLLPWRLAAARRRRRAARAEAAERAAAAGQLARWLAARWLDPRTEGVFDEGKLARNAALRDEVENGRLAEVEPRSLDPLRLATLALLGDRPKPAELLVPFLRERIQGAARSPAPWMLSLIHI